METWCFLGILFSLPHNKADVYLRAALNGQNNDRCEADREELDVHNVVFWIVTQQGT